MWDVGSTRRVHVYRSSSLIFIKFLEGLGPNSSLRAKTRNSTNPIIY